MTFAKVHHGGDTYAGLNKTDNGSQEIAWWGTGELQDRSAKNLAS
jgi:hypothetical protein